MVTVPVDGCPVLLTRVAAGRHQVLTRDDAPGPLFYRRLAALGMLCDLGRVLKQVPRAIAQIPAVTRDEVLPSRGSKQAK